MSATSDAFLSKAQESLTGAASEFSNGRYNNAANRMYYACFHAGIAALDVAGVRPPRSLDEWSHRFVQSQLAGILIARRKLYPSAFRGLLAEAQTLREQADYQIADVTRRQVSRVLAQAHDLVNAVNERVQGAR